MSLTDQKWDHALDGAQAYEPMERERLRRALDLAQSLLQDFPGRLDWVAAAFRSYSATERRMPLMVQAPYRTADEHDELRWALAQRVLGPVFKATRISMPVTLVPPQAGGNPSGPGLLYRHPSFGS